MGADPRTQRYIRFFVYVVAVILINIVGMTLFFRVDLTAGNQYSLSAASRQVVTDIAEPLTIKIFFTENLPPPHNTTERYLHDLLATYAAHAGKRFNYRFYNVTSGGGEGAGRVDANRELARQYGIYPVQVQSIEADEVKFRQAFMGLAIIHGDMIETISPLDTTEGLEYRITTGILKLVNKISAFLNLEQAVDVRLVLSSSLYPVAPLMGIDHLEEIPETVRDVVSGLNSRLPGMLNFEAVDPARTPERLADFEDDDLLRLEWPEIDRPDGTTIPAGEGVAGLVMTWQDRRVDLPIVEVVDIPLFGAQYSIPETRELEIMIDQSLETLIGINDQIGYLTDHGTLEIPPSGAGMMDHRRQTGEASLVNFRALVEKSYSIQPVSPAEDDLGGEYGSLIIAGPGEPFSDYDLYRIDQYLMRGNNLALFLDRFQSSDPGAEAAMYAQPEFEPIDTGLEKLLAHYGVSVEQSVVMDESCYRQRDNRLGGEETAFYFAPLIKHRNINNEPDFMKNIKGLVTMKVSPLVLDETRLAENGIAAAILFSSSDQSWEVRENIRFNPMFIHPPGPGEERQSYPLACLLEGEFPSYFADREIPERQAGGKGDSLEEMDISGQADPAGAAITAAERQIKQGRPARIFVMGSSRMLGDHMLDREGRYPNSIFIMNLLDALNDREDMALLRSKQQAYNPVDELSTAVKSSIKWLNIVGLPVLVVLSGFLVMMLRMFRKRRIREMFAPAE